MFEPKIWQKYSGLSVKKSNPRRENALQVPPALESFLARIHLPDYLKALQIGILVGLF